MAGPSENAAIWLSFFAGVATSVLLKSIIWDKKANAKRKENAGATAEGNDLSLFYGNTTITNETLNTVTTSKFLEDSLYARLVRETVVCCVDICLVRRNAKTNKKECLLVERSSEPAKGVWWWPGGRLLKGETFFDAAKRKALQETGVTVTPIQVLGVWNTFFPTSAWDTEESKGTQTVNPIVLVEMDQGETVKLDAQSENYRWISLDPKRAMEANEDRYVLQALLRLQSWNPNYDD